MRIAILDKDLGGAVFGIRKSKPAGNPERTPDDILAAHLQQTLSTNPFAGPQIAGKAIFEQVLAALKNERGVQIETLCLALGGLAGRACSLAATHGLATRAPGYAGLSLNEVRVKDGSLFLFGDALNWPVAEMPYSVWALVGGAVQNNGGVLPDLVEVFSHSASTVGSPSFGVPRFAAGAESSSLPKDFLPLWSPLLSPVKKFVPNPLQWPSTYGFALQEALSAAAGSFDLEVLARIMMDSAIAMSKVPPNGYRPRFAA